MTKQAIDELFSSALKRVALLLRSETILLDEDDFNYILKTAFNDGFIVGCTEMDQFTIRFPSNSTLTVRLDK